MADGLTTQSGTLATIPTSTVIATDDAGAAGHVQVVKLAVSTDGSATPLTADNTDGLLVKVTNPTAIASTPISSQSQTSTGLTTSSTAYSDGDQLGAILTFTSMASTSGGRGRVIGARLVDAADIIGNVDLFLFSDSVTLAADNAAGPGTSDADTLNCVGVIQLPPAIDVGGARIAAAGSISIPYVCGATSLYVAMVTRTAHTFFGAATDLNLRLFYET